MNRRKFVRSALITGSAFGAALPLTAAIANPQKKAAALMDNTHSKKQQWYELRTYHFANDSQRQLTAAYLEQAYLPALNRAGCSNIGVFFESQPQAAASQSTNPQPQAAPSQSTNPQPQSTPSQPPSIPQTYLLIPFDSIDAFTTINEKLSRDNVYTKAAEPYLSAPATSLAYQRIESNLLHAFKHMPVIEPPEKKERIFELRCYESPTESAGQKKIEMFNDAGEIDVFKRIGARPVFFGETLIGQRRPNLTYMLCFDNMEAHDTHWKAFGNDPRWKELKAMDEYSDARLISKITRTFLTPAAYSQV